MQNETVLIRDILIEDILICKIKRVVIPGRGRRFDDRGHVEGFGVQAVFCFLTSVVEVTWCSSYNYFKTMSMCVHSYL